VVAISKLKLLKDEKQSGAGGSDVIEDVQLLLRAASHRLYGTVLVRQPHKKIARAETRRCPEEAKQSESDEYFGSGHSGLLADDGPAPDFDVSEWGFPSWYWNRNCRNERQSGI